MQRRSSVQAVQEPAEHKSHSFSRAGAGGPGIGAASTDRSDPPGDCRAGGVPGCPFVKPQLQEVQGTIPYPSEKSAAEA
ncbi:hypothetical protein D3C73_1410970 [compost metagenome]